MALTFFWRAEGATLDVDHDFSAGDTIASLINSMTISTTAVRIGTNGLLGAVSAASSANFSSVSIFPGTTTAPSDSVGCMACSHQFVTAFPGSGQNGPLRFRGTNALDAIFLETGTNKFRLSIGNPTSTTLLTSNITISPDTWYGFVIRWDFPGNRRAIEVYDSSSVLLEALEDTATNLSSFIPTEVNNIMGLGSKSGANVNTTWADCFMVGNTYNEPLQNNLTKSSYTLYDGSLGTPATLMGQALS